MKKVLVIVLIAAAVSAAIYIYTSRKSAAPSAAIDATAQRGLLEADPLLGSLSRKVIFYLRLEMKNFAPVGAAFSRLQGRLEASSAGKKFDLAALRDQAGAQFRSSFWQKLEEKEDSVIALRPVIEQILEYARSLERIDLAISDSTVKGPSGVAMPLIFSQFGFEDENVVKSLTEKIEKQLLQEQQSFQKGRITFTRKASGDYKIEIQDNSGETIKALLELHQAALRLFVFTENPSDFFPKRNRYDLLIRRRRCHFFIATPKTERFTCYLTVSASMI